MGNGVDNARVENCTVENITVDFDPSSTYVDVKGTATLKSNDQPSGTDMTKPSTVSIWTRAAIIGALTEITMSPMAIPAMMHRWRGTSKCLANSEYCVNK